MSRTDTVCPRCGNIIPSPNWAHPCVTPADPAAVIAELPVLGMFPRFTRWVLAGSKTSTLRSKVYPDGRYLLRISGKPVATIQVQSDGRPIFWPALDDVEQSYIAEMEGFSTQAEFEAALRDLKIHGNYWLRPFLEGTKPLYLHLLSDVRTIAQQPTDNAEVGG